MAPADDFLPEEPAPAAGARHWVRLAWSQTTLLEPAFWWASGAVMLLGLLAGALDGAAATLFALSAPVLAAGAVACSFRPVTRSLWELERVCPIQPLELIYARVGLVLFFNLLVTCSALGLVWLQEPRTILWRLIVAWLGPLLGLAGVALYSTVRWGAIVGSAAPLALWAALVAGGLQAAGARGDIPFGRALLERVAPTLSQSNIALLLSLLALALGMGLIRQAGRLAAGGESTWS